MSGTSADGIDVALVSFEGAHCALVERPDVSRMGRRTARRLVALGEGGDATSLDTNSAPSTRRSRITFADAANRPAPTSAR
jgi:anhydro-N-acetylmuramic acid kinase